ncbi:hypothetical protein [Spiroplasma apis]|uniref:Uncharacterized protein n=1 Tax=Spiroplasma apis B31 TaxID=1276258 RepID=V5RHV0_SPIAP|nr:hypothetical protein [Spiroplasma apis]AHB36262.1 hypothetical protein SAPIS_v1c04160 [Spiroplasma apis B31]
MWNNYLQDIIYKMLEIKLIEVKKQIKQITIVDIYDYLKNVIFKKNKIRDVNDASFYIMNIKVNKLFEYMNINVLLDKTNTIETDLKSILEG